VIEVCTRVKRDVVTWLVGIVTVDKQTDVYFYVIKIITVFFPDKYLFISEDISSEISKNKNY